MGATLHRYATAAYFKCIGKVLRSKTRILFTYKHTAS